MRLTAGRGQSLLSNKISGKEELLKLLEDVRDGSAAPEEALLKIQSSPFDDLGYAKVDLQRGIRLGVGEVIYGKGKTPGQILGIVQSMLKNGLDSILVTRMSESAADLLEANGIELERHPVAGIGVVARRPKSLVGKIVVASAGTSDMAVCEEAAITAEVFGSLVERVYDAGVAGLSRLIARLDVLNSARVIIAVAGMEGALPSVIGGLVSCPVIAVPTSVGYGANFGGLSALLSMLNSCASGVSVVNIDNGFGAGFLAHRINKIGL
jgi:NCAIR mutase (PurE)-related protein